MMSDANDVGVPNPEPPLHRETAQAALSEVDQAQRAVTRAGSRWHGHGMLAAVPFFFLWALGDHVYGGLLWMLPLIVLGAVWGVFAMRRRTVVTRNEGLINFLTILATLLLNLGVGPLMAWTLPPGPSAAAVALCVIPTLPVLAVGVWLLRRND